MMVQYLCIYDAWNINSWDCIFICKSVATYNIHMQQHLEIQMCHIVTNMLEGSHSPLWPPYSSSITVT